MIVEQNQMKLSEKIKQKQLIDLKFNTEYLVLRIGKQMKKDLSKTAHENESNLTDFVTNIIHNNYSRPKDKVNKKEPTITKSDVYDDIIYEVAL